tara:strand:- start:1248 stop:2645 length:1398 start_codon:yes stop_codon:yes gene_type:complete
MSNDIDINQLWTKEEVINATKAKDFTLNFLNSVKITGVSIDTRTLKKNELFIAIKGKNFDGHHFIEEAINIGASGVIVSSKKDAIKFKGLYVDDTLKALFDLGNFSRKRFNGKIIAITGSNGKTSTKDMANIIFSKFGKSHATSGNNNNIIGLSLTLSRLNKSYDYCILELGMSNKQELKKLSLIAKPDFVIITNVSKNHLENFKSEEEIALAKSEIFHGLKKNGIILLNYDNKWFNFLERIAVTYTNKIIPFGLKKSILTIQETDDNVIIQCKKFKLNLNHLPKYLVINLISILSLIKYLNLNLLKIKSTLSKLSPTEGRGNIFKIRTKNNEMITIINDAYNSSPESLNESLKNLYINSSNKYVLIIGDMLELGPKSLSYHKKLIPIIKKINPRTLLTIGNISQVISDNLENNIFCKHFKNVTLLKKNFEKLINHNDIILIKGSNSIGLYGFCNYLKENYEIGE